MAMGSWSGGHGAPFLVLGVDPGTTNPGLVVLSSRANGWRLEHHEKLGVRKGEDKVTRVHRILEAMAWQAEGVHLICCEEQEGVSVGKRIGFNAGNYGVHRMQGSAEMLAIVHRIPFSRVPPQTAKKHVTGNGNATKTEVQRAITTLVHGAPADLSQANADACAVAIAGSRMPARRFSEL